MNITLTQYAKILGKKENKNADTNTVTRSFYDLCTIVKIGNFAISSQTSQCSCEMFAQYDSALSLSSNSMYKDEVEKTEALIHAIYITERIEIMALHSKNTLFRKKIQSRSHELFWAKWNKLWINKKNTVESKVDIMTKTGWEETYKKYSANWSEQMCIIYNLCMKLAQSFSIWWTKLNNIDGRRFEQKEISIIATKHVAKAEK